MQLPQTELVIKPEWIDHNGHMNVAYYVLAFDEATDAVYETWGLGIAYPERGFSVYTLGINVDYLRELFAGDAVRITTQLIDCDHKRVHYVHQMFHADSGELAATNECLGMNIHLESKRSAAFPDDVWETLTQILKEHRHVEMPTDVGRTLQIRKEMGVHQKNQRSSFKSNSRKL